MIIKDTNSYKDGLCLAKKLDMAIREDRMTLDGASVKTVRAQRLAWTKSEEAFELALKRDRWSVSIVRLPGFATISAGMLMQKHWTHAFYTLRCWKRRRCTGMKNGIEPWGQLPSSKSLPVRSFLNTTNCRNWWMTCMRRHFSESGLSVCDAELLRCYRYLIL